MDKRLRVSVSLIILMLGAAAFSIPQSQSAEKHAGEEKADVVVDGLQQPLTEVELAAVSDLVVRGTSTAEAERAFVDNPQIPDAAKDDEAYANSTYHQVTVRVDEILSASANSTVAVGASINVSTLAKYITDDGLGGVLGGTEDVRLAAGQEYVLFLDLGTGLWTGSYLAQGSQGVGEVSGNNVTFRDGDTTTLDQLRTGLLKK